MTRNISDYTLPLLQIIFQPSPRCQRFAQPRSFKPRSSRTNIFRSVRGDYYPCSEMFSTLVHMGTSNYCDLTKATCLRISFCWTSNTRGNDILINLNFMNQFEIKTSLIEFNLYENNTLISSDRMEMGWILAQGVQKFSLSRNTRELSYPF